ncbi:hypothetical protein MN116_007582 [Schistosoma mekongi]|uniref:Protein kinase domain-containing protein n=1 Tax=Schistosoma mekongi TaxID=38744 RepID=A0AAE1Z895_SCHME|nr:hypothetical protein MN116_007582 [Schistosoma mekongi]
MNASTRRLLSQEISILESLHHPNIIRLYEVIETFSRLNLIMEYVAGGDLNRRIKKYGKLSEPVGRIVFAQLIAAVNHLHERNIIHRDIKAENILFTYDFQHVQQTSSRTMTTATSSSTTGTTTGTSGKKANLEKMPRNNLKMHHTTNFHNNNNRTGKMHKLLLLRNRSHSSKRNDDGGSSSNMTTNYHNSLQRKQQHFTDGHSHSTTPVRMNAKDGKKSVKRKLQKVNSMEDDQIDDTFNDICPDHYRVKLVDFGFSKLIKDINQPLTTFCGSPAYAAPELFESKSYRGGPVDMWALGIVLFFMLTGLLPFSGTTVEQVRRLVLDNRGLQPPDSLSPAAADLYRNLTARQPELRPTASQLIKYAQFARKDLTPIEIILRQRSTWTNWLTGQTFPKPLPRFKHCPPLPSTFQIKSNLLQPSSSECNITILNNDKNKSIDKTSLVDIISSSCNSIHNESINTTTNNTTDNNNNVIMLTNELDRKCLTYQKQVMDSNKGDANDGGDDDDDDNAELEAANYLLLNLGITTDEIKNSHNYATRCAVTGVYRIMLHKIHRSRRLSRLDPIVTSPSTSQENNTKSLKFNSALPSIQSSTNIDQNNFNSKIQSNESPTNSLKPIHSLTFNSVKQPLHQEKSSSRLCYLI